MKRVKLIFAAGLLMMISACSQDNAKKDVYSDRSIMQKEQTLEMNEDTLDAKITKGITDAIEEQKSHIEEEALTVVGETQKLFQLIESNKKEEAIDFGHKLIGKLEVLLTKDPTLSLIPIDVNFQKDELITDIETVRNITKAAQTAMDEGYYQLASDLLDDLRSEIVINTYYIPTATYPDAIKASVALLEEDDVKGAKAILQSITGTIVTEQLILPLPVLKAEQMIIEAASIDKKDHENSNKVLNLLKNAEYQLTLAEEMGYGKKNKDYTMLNEAIKTLEKSVKDKAESQDAFDSLKVKIKAFKEKIFSNKE